MTARVVVGVDGSPESLTAVGFAAAEAVARHADLRIVHALGEGSPADPHVRAQAEKLVATARALVVTPGLRVTTAIVPGGPIAALAHESRAGTVLVLGRRARPDDPVRAHSVTAHVPALAACPVLVARTGVPHARGVLVVTCASPPTASAIRFAADEATARGGEVSEHVADGDPDALLEATGRAALLVIGVAAGPIAPLPAALSRLLGQARCPVAVVTG